MAISWSPATWSDIERGLSIEERNRGDALVGLPNAIESWKVLARDPFFASAALESAPPIHGHRLIGFGASVIVSPEFAAAEISSPRPDINSRIIAGIHSGEPVLATRKQVAAANAGPGVDVVILYGSSWRHEILSPAQSHEAQNLLALSFTQWHAGYRMRTVLCETANANASDFFERSVVYRPIARFQDQQRTLYCKTTASTSAVSGSLGNVQFSYRMPEIRLSASDQELLAAALSGATDIELSSRLGITLSAVKARWRSAMARIEDAVPELMRAAEDREGRGQQKRHRVLAYVRAHPEELRPFDWTRKNAATAAD